MHKNSWITFTYISIVLWAIYPVLAWATVRDTPPFFSLVLTFTISSILFLPVITWKRGWSELKNPLAWKYGFLAAIFIDVVLYGLYYSGLRFTSANNAALVAQAEVIFSYFFFQIIRKERFTREHIFWTILILLGATYLLFPGSSKWNIGDVMVCLAFVFAPLGNLYQKKWREHISSTSFLFIRYICSIPLVLLMSIGFWEIHAWIFSWQLFWQIWGMSLLVFVVLNIFWVESIKDETVTRILALYGLVPFFTMLIMWALYHTAPTSAQLISGIPMFLGVYLLTKK